LSQIKWLTVAELVLDSGTEYLSAERVRRNTSPGQIIYQGTVQRWGYIEKSIPAPSGMPQISDARVRIADNLRKWRDLFIAQPARRRIMRIWEIPEGASIADYDPIYTGEVQNVVFPAAAIEVELRDITFAWLDEPIPAMAVSSIFPDIAPQDEGGFIPIIFGDVLSPEVSPANTQGVIPLPHIGWLLNDDASASLVDRWAASLTPVLSVTVFRRKTVSLNEDIDSPEWEEVDSSEYNITEQGITAEDNPFGFGAFTITHVDFIEQQPEGTEIRADIQGIVARGAWGSLAPNDGLALSPPESLKNPIDAFINMTYMVLAKAGISTDVFDKDHISDLWHTFESLGLECNGAITQPMTAREWLGQFLPSFELTMFPKRSGLISLDFTQDPEDISPPPTIPVFKEGKHILKGTFEERLPEEVTTQLQYRWNYNNATGEFASGAIFDSDEQSQLNLPDENSPTNIIDKIEKNVVDLYFVRDAATAEDIIQRRMDYLALGSFRQTFEMPLPETYDEIELTALCKITHSMGLGPGGYDEQTAKILKVTYDLDGLVVRLETQAFPPIPLQRFGRPTPEAFDAVNLVRSTITDFELGADNDAPLGESTTFCYITLIHPNTVAQYCHLKFIDFPDSSGAPLASITIHVVLSYTVGTGTLIGFNFPIVSVDVYDAYTSAVLGTPEWSAHHVTSVYAGDGSGNIPITDVSVTYTPTQWSTSFGGTSEDLMVRAELIQTSLEDFSPACVMKIYDCWIEYEYA
jgi:hypothetical protein